MVGLGWNILNEAKINIVLVSSSFFIKNNQLILTFLYCSE